MIIRNLASRKFIGSKIQRHLEFWFTPVFQPIDQREFAYCQKSVHTYNLIYNLLARFFWFEGERRLFVFSCQF